MGFASQTIEMAAFVNFKSNAESASSCPDRLSAAASKDLPGYQRRKSSTPVGRPTPLTSNSSGYSQEFRASGMPSRTDDLSDLMHTGGTTSQQVLEGIRPLMFLLLIIIPLFSLEVILTEEVSFHYIFQM